MQPSRRKQETVVHRLLHREYELARQLGDPLADSNYRNALAKLESTLQGIEAEARALPTPIEATAYLEAFDRAMVRENFVLCIKTEMLMGMLNGEDLDGCSRRNERLLPNVTPERSQQWVRLREEREAGTAPKVHFFDCDLGTMLFVAAGERLGQAMSMAEMPDHNYVRWRIAQDNVINWDVNTAAAYSDERFAAGTPTAPGCPECPRRGDDGLFVSLTTKELEGYHYFLMSLVGQKADPALGEQLLRKSLELRAPNAVAENNLGWLLAVSPHYTSTKVGAEAVTHARVATGLRPWDPEFQDTLSCALAAAGRFDEAVVAERAGYSKKGRFELYAAKRDCRGAESL